MKIKSNYKDYYDHVAFKYGGGDPKIVYVRPHRLVDIPELKDIEMTMGKYRKKYKSHSLRNLTTLANMWENSLQNAQVRGIIVGDKLFTQIKHTKESDYRLVREKDLKDPVSNRHYFRWDDPLKLSDYINFYDPDLINICKSVNLPVFAIDVNGYQRTFTINKLLPNLGKVGVAGYIDANEMYQNLSYLIGNLMHDSPDMMPPVIVSDKIKILGHGFDYKTSFRGKVI